MRYLVYLGSLRNIYPDNVGMSDLFIYMSNISQYNMPGEYLARISSVKNKDQLLSELALTLNFPNYFGHNWDALNECINDLHWIENKKITLIHENIPDLKFSDLQIYIEILKDAVLQWKTSDEHVLSIIFPQTSENIISALLTDQSV